MNKGRVCKNCRFFDEEKAMLGCRIAYAAFNHPVWELDESNFGCSEFKKKKIQTKGAQNEIFKS